MSQSPPHRPQESGHSQDRVSSSNEQDLDVYACIFMHLWPLFGIVSGGFFLPLIIAIPIIWAFRKPVSPLVDDQGREIMNSILTLLLLVISIIGWVMLLVWIPIWLVNCVRGAIASGHREYFRYPMVLRFIS